MLVVYLFFFFEFQKVGKEVVFVRYFCFNIFGLVVFFVFIWDVWIKFFEGNVFFECYGMIEVGMVILCGLNYSDCVESFVGWFLFLVEV